MTAILEKQPNIAILITGTAREVNFLLQLLPLMAGDVDYDVYLALRHVNQDEMTRLGLQEKDFNRHEITALAQKNIFLCELPCFDPDVIKDRFLIPSGPTGVARECGAISMFQGVFTAISMMKSSLRNYTHVLKTRTDFLPWIAPWLPSMLKIHEKSGKKIIIDDHFRSNWLYADRPDIPWQGTLSDVYCFADLEQFLSIWDIESILPKVWTGVAETTLFRAAMHRILGDSLQSPRRNEAFANKYFTWLSGETQPSFYLLQNGVLSDEIKTLFVKFANRKTEELTNLTRLLKAAHDFLLGENDLPDLESLARQFLTMTELAAFLAACGKAAQTTPNAG